MSLIIVIDIPAIIMSPAVMKLLLLLYHYFNTVALLKQVNRRVRISREMKIAACNSKQTSFAVVTLRE